MFVFSYISSLAGGNGFGRGDSPRNHLDQIAADSPKVIEAAR